MRKLGRGGMGEVWLAEHVTIKSQVAIKLVLAAPEDQEAASRFLREAKATARIRHPGVVTVSDYGPRPSGGAFLVMELLDGESLADRLDRGPLSSERAIDLGVQIAEALVAAHAVGVVHRDLKPANVFLVPDAAVREGTRVKLVDFGVAKATGKVTDELGMTVTGALVGTPIYMAPEQCSSRKGPVDHRADLYALGVVLYQMVTGNPPFRGPTLGDLIDQHLNQIPVPPRTQVPTVSAKLDHLIVTLLAKDREDRPATANEVAGVLHELRGTSAPAAKLELEATHHSGGRPFDPASVGATLDSGDVRSASPVASHAVTQATSSDARPPVSVAAHRPGVAVTGPARRVPRGLIYGVIGGFVVSTLIIVGLLVGRERTSPTASLPAAEVERRCSEGDAANCRELALRELGHSQPPPDFTKVAGALVRACDGHDQIACAHLGRLHLSGRGVHHDYARARTLATTSCDAGVALGCELIGEILATGIGGEVDGPGGLARRTRACELGSAYACHEASRSLRFGLGMEIDVAAADRLLATAISTADASCTRGDLEACRTRALIYALGDGHTEDPVRAAPLLDRACRGGVAAACGDLGNLYFAGMGVSRDVGRGLVLIEQGCEAGDDNSCTGWVGVVAHGMAGTADPVKAFNLADVACRDRGDRNCGMLADLYQSGIGATADKLRASELYMRACRGGIGDSCMLAALLPPITGARSPEEIEQLRTRGCFLGSFLSCGALGRALQPKDPAKALALFQRACGLSANSWGCEDVATAYLDGVGVAADPKRGRDILERGCAIGTTIACRHLGRRLRDGRVLAKDPARAIELLEKSCAAADPYGCREAATMLRTGDGIAADVKRAAVLEDRQCMLEPSLCPNPASSGSGSAGSGR
ncbi:MAG: protein kinase [Myxococcales bacterium]|nr:protein kinase [Myxococcales bacterium]